ncbi:hypothetical protein GCM10018780_29700 [Streptomyces lanatus]|nr:hypothetical protein GCM10018780_29700 [Streptomyces lanatus]
MRVWHETRGRRGFHQVQSKVVRPATWYRLERTTTCALPAKPSEGADDPDEGSRLWAASEHLTGVTFDLGAGTTTQPGRTAAHLGVSPEQPGRVGAPSLS